MGKHKTSWGDIWGFEVAVQKRAFQFACHWGGVEIVMAVVGAFLEFWRGGTIVQSAVTGIVTVLLAFALFHIIGLVLSPAKMYRELNNKFERDSQRNALAGLYKSGCKILEAETSDLDQDSIGPQEIADWFEEWRAKYDGWYIEAKATITESFSEDECACLLDPLYEPTEIPRIWINTEHFNLMKPLHAHLKNIRRRIDDLSGD